MPTFSIAAAYANRSPAGYGKLLMTRLRAFLFAVPDFVFPTALPPCSDTSSNSGHPRTLPDRKRVTARAGRHHDSALIIDTHADTPQRFLDENFDLGSSDPNDIGHISLDKAKRGNLGAEFFSIWVDPETNQGHFARHTFDLIDSVYQQAARGIPTA